MKRRTVGAMAAVALIALAGCHVKQTGAAPAATAPGGTAIGEEEIARMGVRTAWDVVRLRAPRLTYALDANARPTGIRIQEQRSIHADETVLLVVDGVPMMDLEYLMQIPAAQVHLIRVLNAEAAEPIYGLRAAAGAIVVEMKRGIPQP